MIRSSHNSDYVFRVTHLNKVSVETGDQVDIGDKIGEIGNTGGSKGSHAHCALYKAIHGLSYGNRPGLDRLECGNSLGISGSRKNFAAKFVFDATVGGEIGSGGGTTPSAEIIADGPLDLCKGADVQLTLSAGQSYLWSTGETTQSITVSNSGDYTGVVTHSDGSQLVGGPVTISELEALEAFLFVNGFDTVKNYVNLNADGKLTLNASEGTKYVWSTGETTSSITVSQPGDYWVSITGFSDCQTAYKAVTVNAATSIKDVALVESFSIYPNPSNGTFELYLKSDRSHFIDVNILDALGRNVYAERSQEVGIRFKKTFNLSHLAKGVYTVNIISNGNTLNKRIVIE